MSRRAWYAAGAWLAATATAMGVVWAGLDAVLPTADSSGPHVATIAAWPAQNGTGPTAAPSQPAPAPSPVASLTRDPGSVPPPRTSAASPSATTPRPPAPSSAPPASPPGTEQRYTTPGGTALLTLGAKTATLDAAIPNPGYSARSWTGSDFLEVEFVPADTTAVYEVIATWNGTSPQVQTATVGG